MAFSYGPYTFDAQADGDAAAFLWTDQTGTTSALQNNNTAGRWCWHNSNTTSNNVGPDNGQGGTGDGYAYTEMSSQTSGDIWIVEFDTTLDASANNITFEYYWCLRGDACRATIQLQTNENGAGWVDRGPQTGYGDEIIPATSGATTWWNKSVDLTGLISHASTRIRLYIVSTADPTTEMWHNDLGIDGVTITGTTLVSDPEITDVDGDNVVEDNQTGVVITGSSFGVDLGGGVVTLCATPTWGSPAYQVVTDWQPTEITVTILSGGLALGTNYIFVENDAGDRNAVGFEITLTGIINETGHVTRVDADQTLYAPQATISHAGSFSVIANQTQLFDPVGSAGGSAFGSLSTVDSGYTMFTPTGKISVSGAVGTVITETAAYDLQATISVSGSLPRIDLTMEPLPVRGGALEAPVSLQEITISLFDPTARISVAGIAPTQNVGTTLYDTVGTASMLGTVETISIGYEMGIAKKPPSGFVPWVLGAGEAGLSQVGSAKVAGEPGIAASTENKPKVSSIKDSSTLVPGIKDAVHPY